jgi:RNA polymerase II subunit A small phosphatase-like protein
MEELLSTMTQNRRNVQDLSQESIAKLHVVLDLDGTLIFSANSPMNSLDFEITFQLYKTTETLSIKKRPFLDQFLQYCLEHFNVEIFTASARPYAEAVLKKLYHKKFWKRLYCREYCELDGTKDLSKISKDMRRTILIDDSSFVFRKQPQNGILIESFQGQSCDNELSIVLEKLKHLNAVPDVRTELEPI